jgi:hypothetical protein
LFALRLQFLLLSRPHTHTEQRQSSSTPSAAATAATAAANAHGLPPKSLPQLTEDQRQLVHDLRRYGFVGATGFVRKMPNWAIWDAIVEVDMMGEERRSQFRSLGALIRYLVREACSE